MKKKHVSDFKTFIKESLSNDFENIINDDWYRNKAEYHIDSWEERYASKSISDIEFDLNVNHDISLEIEDAEEELGRELTNQEYDEIETKFNKAVIDILKERSHNILEDEDYEDYEILYQTDEEYDGKSLGVVEYDSSSNKPFMVYILNKDTMDYESFSGEDDLDTAIDVVDSEV